jgi:hypothetical protein
MTFTPLTNGDYKGSVKVSPTANVTVASPGTSTFDSVVISTGDRMLLKSQTTASENGIYKFNGAGSALTRADDADTTDEYTLGMLTYVESGTSNGNKWWYISSTSPLTFSQLGGGAGSLSTLSDVSLSSPGDGALLRYESTGTVWNDTDNLTFNDAGALVISTTGGNKNEFQITSTTANTGITVGADTNLYRAAANLWRTDDDLAIGSTSKFSFEVTGNRFALSDANIDHIDSGTDNYIQLRGSVDSQPRIRLGIGVGTGTTPGILFGPGGVTTADVNLYRSAANVLKSDDDIRSAADINSRDTSAQQISLTSVSSLATIRFGTTGTVDLQHLSADVIGVSGTDKIQQAALPTTANDLTNQVYTDRMVFFLGA